jgi:hypothetical protein
MAGAAALQAGGRAAARSADDRSQDGAALMAGRQKVPNSPYGTSLPARGVTAPVDASRPNLSTDPGYGPALGDAQWEVPLIRSRIILGRDHQAALRGEQTLDYGFYDMDYEITMPEDAEKIPYPGPRSDVDTIVDHLIPDLVATQVTPATESAANRALANLHEHLYNGLWEQTDLQAAAYDVGAPVRMACKDGVIAGEFCFEVYDQSYLWGDEPKRKASPEHELWELRKQMIPRVYCGVVDPREIYSDPARPARWAVKEYERQTVDIIGQLEAWERQGVDVQWPPGLRDGKFWTADQTRRWQEYYGESEYDPGVQIKCFLVDEMPVVGPVDNPLGFIPFVKRSAGGGRGGPNTAPEHRVWGIIRTVRPFYEAVSRRLTQWDSIVQTYAWGTWVAAGDTAQMDINLGPNTVSLIPGGSTLTPQYPPPMALAPIADELRQLMDITQWATSPQVLRGQKSQGVSAAYHYVLQLQEARLKIVALKRAMEMAMVEVCRLSAIMLKQAGEPVNVMTATEAGGYQAETLAADSINPSLRIKVDLQQETPEENDHRIAIGERLHEKGRISWMTFQQDYLKNADPEREYKRIQVDKFLNSPEVQAAFNEGVAREYDAGLYDKLLQARERMRQQVGTPPPVQQPGMGDVQPTPEQAAGIGPAGAMPGSQQAMQQQMAGNAQMMGVRPNLQVLAGGR